MSWDHLEKNPPWFVRCMARRKVHAKVVVAVSDEELAISSGIPVARIQAIYHQRNWDSIPMREIRAFCAACGFDPFSFKSRNRFYAYKAAVRSGRCTTPTSSPSTTCCVSTDKRPRWCATPDSSLPDGPRTTSCCGARAAQASPH